ncbi:MAG: proline racemase family protein [Cohaesibacter sp.]|nr:proline racemase family protein [Cohaesibacter sp.]
MRVIDSHTAGEPTRTIIEGGPSLQDGPRPLSLKEQAARLERDHMDFCQSVLLEPRGHDAIVGALLVPPSDPDCVTGVIYFNPTGALGMCGHATIGLAVTLAHMGRIAPGIHKFETPVGIVSVKLHSPNKASVVNVESYRHLKDVTLNIDGPGPVMGDVAWGGNWFFLTKNAPSSLDFANIADLTQAATKIRKALTAQKITGKDGGEIDHIEFTGPAHVDGNDGRNFVLCPGGAYDRSPCGTGTSAKVACLAEDGLLAPQTIWRQESIIDSLYEVSYQPGEHGGIIPTITGEAYVTAQTELLFDPKDPYAKGITAQIP